MSVNGGKDGNCMGWYRAALALCRNHERVAKPVLGHDLRTDDGPSVFGFTVNTHSAGLTAAKAQVADIEVARGFSGEVSLYRRSATLIVYSTGTAARMPVCYAILLENLE